MNLWRALTIGSLIAVTADGATFGIIRTKDGAATPISWLPAERVTIADGTLHFTVGGTSLQSHKLPLRLLCLYQISITTRRGPGTVNRFTVVFTDEKGATHRRQPSWQYRDAARPNWIPFAPVLQEYVTGLILPRETKNVWLELAMDPPDKPELAPYGGWELSQLDFTERQAVPFGGRLGPNRLPAGNMETVTADGKPSGWSWTGGGDRLQLIETTASAAPAHDGRYFLRILPGNGMLFGPIGVAAQPGTAWRITLWVRGKGAVSVLTHPLDRDDPNTCLRVGDAQNENYPVDARAWTQLEHVWFAESPHVRFGQLVLGINATEPLDVDDVQFQRFERSQDGIATGERTPTGHVQE